MVTLIEITTPDCGVCKMMEPMVKKALEIYSHEQLKFIKLNAREGEGARLCETYNRHQVPVFLFYNSNGDLIFQNEGSMPLGAIRAKINSILTD